MKRDPKPTDPLAAHVAAWHNRQPLARRVAPRHVLGVGVVALPFRREGGAVPPARHDAPMATPVELTTPLDGSEVDLVFDDSPPAALQPAPDAEPPAPDIVADGPSPAASAPARSASPLGKLRARLRLPARRQRVAPALQGLQPAFAQGFLAPLRPADVASFALEHGSLNRPGGDDWPQRDVTASVADDVITVYLRTAAIEVGGQRVRVLIGNGFKPAIVGARLSSPLRAGVLSAMLAGGAALALDGLPWLHGEDIETAAVLAAPSAPASSSSASGAMGIAVAAPQAPLPSDEVPAAPPAAAASAQTQAQAQAQAAPASAGATAAASAPRASRTAVAAASATVPRAATESPAPARRQVVAIVPRLSEEERAAARAESVRLRGERHGAAMQAAAAGPAKAIPASDGRHFALVTRTTRSRAASEIVQSLMDTAAASDEFPGSPRTEVMAVGSGFRAVWWPFPSEADAQRGQTALAAYGIKAEIVGF